MPERERERIEHNREKTNLGMNGLSWVAVIININMMANMEYIWKN